MKKLILGTLFSTSLVFVLSIFSGCLYASVANNANSMSLSKGNLNGSRDALINYCNFIQNNSKTIKASQSSIDIMHESRLYSNYDPIIMKTYTKGFAIENIELLKWNFEHYKTDSIKIKKINNFMIEYAKNIINAYELYYKCLNQIKYDKKSKTNIQFYTYDQMQQINLHMKNATSAMHNWEQSMIQMSSRS